MWFSCVFSGLRTESEYIFKRNNTSISILFCCVFRLFLLTNSNSCLLKYVYPNDKLLLPCFVFFFFKFISAGFSYWLLSMQPKRIRKNRFEREWKSYRSRIECISWKVVQTSGTEFGILTNFSFTLPLSMERPMEWNTHIVKKNSDHSEFWMQLWPTLLLFK